MRGKGRTARPAPARARITPAYAGKSKSTFIGQSPAEDHPRVCGEKRVLSSPSFAKIGSPPRMRGKEGVALLSGQIVGITPAYAGKRAAANFHLGTTRDHPRVCGEKGAFQRVRNTSVGSPPRMRGKAQKTEKLAGRCRITPAYAGKSPTAKQRGTLRRDHPRVCGEKHNRSYQQGLERGSPPRMRGKADLPLPE